MKNALITLAIAAIMAGTSSAQVQIAPEWLSLPQNSVANTDDALALLVNPAGLGISGGGACYFLAPYQADGHFEDWGIVVGEAFGFAAEAVRSDPNGSRRRYTWGLGFGDNDFSWGFNYSWTTGIDRQNSWDFGILERPWSFLSFGAVARGINHPRLNGSKLPIGWDVGIGVRPLALLKGNWTKPNDRMTLTLDADLRRFDERPGQSAQKYFEEIDFTYGLAAQIVPGITGHIDYSPGIGGVRAHDTRLWAGLTFNFGDLELGSFQRSGNGAGSAYLAARDISRDTWLKPVRKKIIIIDVEDSSGRKGGSDAVTSGIEGQ